jgi:hypothetical protein
MLGRDLGKYEANWRERVGPGFANWLDSRLTHYLGTDQQPGSWGRWRAENDENNYEPIYGTDELFVPKPSELTETPGISSEQLTANEVDYTPPAPRLVDIETDPGPPKGKGKRKVTGKTALVHKKSTKKQNGRKNKKSQKGYGPAGLGRVAAPASYGARFKGRPTNIKSKGGVLFLKHREMLSDIVGVNSAPFYCDVVALLAGDPLTFGWGGSIMRQFTWHKFNHIKIIYVPTDSTTDTGRVGLAWCGDVTQDGPESESAFMGMTGGTIASAYVPTSLTVPGIDRGWKKVPPNNTTALPSDVSDNDYYTGELYIARYGNSTVNTIGTIFIEYEVELKEPAPAIPTGVNFISGTGTAVASPFSAYTTGTGSTPGMTTDNLKTVTLLTPFNGAVSIALAGAGITAITLTATGTRIGLTGSVGTSNAILLNGTSTVARKTFKLTNCSAGFTFTVDISGTSLTDTRVMFYNGITTNIYLAGEAPLLPPERRTTMSICDSNYMKRERREMKSTRDVDLLRAYKMLKELQASRGEDDVKRTDRKKVWAEIDDEEQQSPTHSVRSSRSYR